MTIHIRLFAILREKAGVGELELTLPDGATAGLVRDELHRRMPALGPWLGRAKLALNQSAAGDDAPLRDGDELALLPPVSGG